MTSPRTALSRFQARLIIQFRGQEKVTLKKEGDSGEKEFGSLAAALRFAESFGPAGLVFISMLDTHGRPFGRATI